MSNPYPVSDDLAVTTSDRGIVLKRELKYFDGEEISFSVLVPEADSLTLNQINDKAIEIAIELLKGRLTPQ